MDCEDISMNPHRLFNRVLAVRFKYGTKSITGLQRSFNESPKHFSRVPTVLSKYGARYVNELQRHANKFPKTFQYCASWGV